MAVTTDEILTRGKGPMSWSESVTSAHNAKKAPSLVKEKEAPVQSALVPPSISPDITSVPNAGQVVKAPPTTSGDDVQTPTDEEQVTPVSKRQTAPEGKRLTYTEMFQQMSPFKPPTPEELEKERKRQKREAIFAAIGEGISAMSNLYFTTQYAPNAYDPSKGMAATTKARFDQLKKDREENQRQYMEGFMRAMRWDAEDERDDRNWQHTLEREKVTDHYKEAADARAHAPA